MLASLVPRPVPDFISTATKIKSPPILSTSHCIILPQHPAHNLIFQAFPPPFLQKTGAGVDLGMRLQTHQI